MFILCQVIMHVYTVLCYHACLYCVRLSCMFIMCYVIMHVYNVLGYHACL